MYPVVGTLFSNKRVTMCVLHQGLQISRKIAFFMQKQLNSQSHATAQIPCIY